MFLRFLSWWHPYPWPYVSFIFDHFASNWFMWGWLFNPTSVRLGFRLVYLLSLSPYQILLPPYGIGSLVSLLALLHVLHFFTKGFKWRCLPCKRALDIRQCPSGFWYFLLMFCPKAFFSLHCFSPFKVFKVNLFFIQS